MINETGATTPTAPSPAAALPGGKLGKDEFLKMLVAQMRNQDPMNPMQGDEMAAQLAQFSSLEQLTNMSNGLADLTQVLSGDMLYSLNSTSAMGAIGKTVLAVSDQVRINAEGGSTVEVEVTGRGVSGELRILDANGKEVGSRDLGPISAGRHTLDVGAAGQGLAPGVYTYEIDVTGATGEPVDVATLVRTRIDGVRYGSSGPILTSGGLSLPFGSILEIASGD